MPDQHAQPNIVFSCIDVIICQVMSIGENIGARQNGGLPIPERFGEWFRRPPLVLIEEMAIAGELDSAPRQAVSDLSSQISGTLAGYFTEKGCNYTVWSGQNLPDHFKDGAVVLSPVVIEVSDQARVTLENSLNLTEPEFRNSLKESIPEIFPLAVQRANDLDLRTSNSNTRLHPGFTNVVFIEDSLGSIQRLPSERITLLNRMLMAKLGAFRNVIVPYKVEDSKAKTDAVILGTLEGGHPTIDASNLESLAYRLMVLGSAKEVSVGELQTVDGPPIPKDLWERSSTVNSLIDLGSLLGSRGLLSDPVEVGDLVNDVRMGKLISRLAGY